MVNENLERRIEECGISVEEIKKKARTLSEGEWEKYKDKMRKEFLSRNVVRPESIEKILDAYRGMEYHGESLFDMKQRDIFRTESLEDLRKLWDSIERHERLTELEKASLKEMVLNQEIRIVCKERGKPYHPAIKITKPFKMKGRTYIPYRLRGRFYILRPARRVSKIYKVVSKRRGFKK